MNFRELNEAEGEVGSAFLSGHKELMNNIGTKASAALSKFKSAAKKAEQDVLADRENAKVAAEKEAEEKEKADKAAKRGSMAAIAGPRSAPITVAGMVIDRAGSPNTDWDESDDLPELDGLDAEHFAYVQNAADQLATRLDKFTKIFARSIKANAGFLGGNEMGKVSTALESFDEADIQSAKKLLRDNKYGERDAWMLVLTKDDANIGAKALVKMIARLHHANAAKNDASGMKKVYATGLKLLELLGAQRQAIDDRLVQFRGTLDQVSQKPVSEALLKRVGRLAKRL